MNRDFCLLYLVLYLSTASKVTSRESYELLQLNGTKPQSVWMRYLLVIHQQCTTRSIKRDLIRFEEQNKNCLQNVYLSAVTCSKHYEDGGSCTSSRQRVKHYCEYTPPDSMGGLHRKTVEKEIPEVTRDISRPMGSECLDVHYTRHRIYSSNFCYLTRRQPPSILDTDLIEQINFQYYFNITFILLLQHSYYRTCAF